MSHILKVPVLKDVVYGIYRGKHKLIVSDVPVDEAHDAAGADAALRRAVFNTPGFSGPVSSLCFLLNSKILAADADHEFVRADLLRERDLLPFFGQIDLNEWMRQPHAEEIQSMVIKPKNARSSTIPHWALALLHDGFG